MPQSLASILIHIVFSTKNRKPFLTAPVDVELHKYLATVARNAGSPTLAIDGVEDHVHLLVSLARTSSIADIVEDLKKTSSKWIKTKGPDFRAFQWQTGYGAFSIGQSNAPALKKYIANQNVHHRKQNFQDEYRTLLRKYEIEFDERYVWD
jgi:putative transposase